MATDKDTSVEDLKLKVKEFCEARDWDQFHNAKDLALALSIEAAELMEIFRWKNFEEVEALFEDEKKREDIEDEMADVLCFLVRLAQRYNINLSEAFYKKVGKTAIRYPVEKAKGSNKKYNEFD